MVLSLLLGGVCYLLFAPQGSRQSSYGQRTAQLSHMLSPFMRRICELTEDVRVSYTLHAKTELDYAPAGGSSASQFEHSSRVFKGTLSLKSMPGGSVEARLSRDGAPAARFAFDLDTRCRIGAFSFSAMVTPDEQSEIVNLLTEMQFVIPVQPAGTAEWESHEADSIGRHVSHYRVAECGAGECRIEKSKLRYDKVTQPVSMPPLQAEIQHSKAEALFSRGDFWIKRAKKEESVQLISADKVLIKAALQAEFELQPGFSWPAADENSPLLAYVEAGQVRTVFRERPESAEVLERRFANMKWPDAVKSFTEMLREDQAGAKGGAVRLLADYLRFQPARARDLTAALRNTSLGDEEQSFAVLALQLADIPEAEAALTGVLEDSRNGSMNRMRAAIALQDLPLPTRTAVDALRREASALSQKTDDPSRDVATTAALSLGSIANNLRTSDPLLAQETEESIEQQLAAEHDPQNIAVLLQSIGNTRNAGFLGTVLMYLKSEDEWVRASAIEAYSKIEGPQQEEIMMRQLAQEAAPAVKREIYRALSQLPVSPLTARAAVMLLPDEKGADVRRELILFVGPHAQKDDQVREALAAHAGTETDGGIVQLIGKFLKVRPS